MYNLVAKEQKPNTIACMYYVYIHMYVSINRNLAVCVIVDLSSFIGQECVQVLFVVVVLLLRCVFFSLVPSQFAISAASVASH